jgi:plastocyanin
MGRWLRGVLPGFTVLPLVAMAADSPTVVQQHRAFSIATLTVPVGTVLHFSNQDDFAHEVFVAAPNFTFESDEQEPGETVSIAFTKRGRFPVRCHIHPKMHLDVDVQ